jgi:two-component system response regulator (stage 0 sporulation protein F)
MEEYKINILIVDDDQGIRSFFKRYLDMLGLISSEAENGYKAVELVKEQKFDLLFIDVRMPGMNGLDTFRAVRQIDTKAVVVMMTGYAVDDILEETKKFGAYDILRKPFDINQIKEVIDVVTKMKSEEKR